MLPTFTLFGKTFGMFGIMAMAGMLTAGFVLCYRIKKAGYDYNDTILYILCLGGGMVVGGSILNAIVNIRLLFYINSSSEIFKVILTMFSGIVFYGGLFGAIAAGLIYIKFAKLPKTLYLDNSALFAPLFHGFARIGCFFGGCCYGIESKFGFSAAHVENKLTTIGDATRFPVQLLEAGCNFILAAVIFVLLQKGLLKGKMLYFYLLCYSVIRFFDEFLRGDDYDRGFVGPFSTSQFISLFVFSFAVFMLFIYPRIKAKKQTIEPVTVENTEN